MLATSGYPVATQAVKKTRKTVLHLVGSRQDEFIHDLSIIYAKACDDCPDLARDRYDFVFAHVHMDGRWSFPTNLTKEAL
jgi:hypothetical protein